MIKKFGTLELEMTHQNYGVYHIKVIFLWRVATYERVHILLKGSNKNQFDNLIKMGFFYSKIRPNITRDIDTLINYLLFVSEKFPDQANTILNYMDED